MRFGDVDYRQLQSMKDLMTSAAQTYYQNKTNAMEMERELAKEQAKAAAQGRLDQLVNQTAEALKGKKQSVTDPATGKSTEKYVPPSYDEERNIVRDFAFKSSAIPGGERFAEHAFRYMESTPKPQYLGQETVTTKGGKQIIQNIYGYIGSDGKVTKTHAQPIYHEPTTLTFQQQKELRSLGWGKIKDPTAFLFRISELQNKGGEDITKLNSTIEAEKAKPLYNYGGKNNEEKQKAKDAKVAAIQAQIDTKQEHIENLRTYDDYIREQIGYPSVEEGYPGAAGGRPTGGAQTGTLDDLFKK